MSIEDSPNTAVVVADDRKRILQSISTILGRAGFTVLAATSEAQALELSGRSLHPVNLAVIDVTSLSHGWVQLVRRLEETAPGIRTLFLASAEQEESIRQELPADRIHGFVRKPYRQASLLGQVLEMMDRPLVLTA